LLLLLLSHQLLQQLWCFSQQVDGLKEGVVDQLQRLQQQSQATSSTRAGWQS
jgi:hypothetical protein